MMTIFSSTVQIKSSGFSHVHNITPKIKSVLISSKIISGIITIFVSGSTAGITTIEHEKGVIEDPQRTIEHLVPSIRITITTSAGVIVMGSHTSALHFLDHHSPCRV